MTIENDFSIDRASKNIRAVAGTSNYTVLEFYRYLQDKADDSSSIGDDQLDITDPVPADKAFDTIINLLGDYNIDDATARRLYLGSITQGAGSSLTRYSGAAIAGSFPAGTAPQIFQNNIKLVNFWGSQYNPDADLGFSHQFLIKTIENGQVIDGGRVRCQIRFYGFDYREASTVLGVGFGVLPLGNVQSDAFNSVSEADVNQAPFNTVSNDSEGYNLIDLNNGAGAVPFYSRWNPNSTDNSGLYNRVKYLARDDSAATLYGLSGEQFRGVTHEVSIAGGAGTWADFEPVSWPTGTAQMLAVDSTNASGSSTLWLQVLTGVAPTAGQTITASGGASATVSAVIERNLSSNSLLGSFFGSVLGGFGVGVDSSFLSATDRVTDLAGADQTPPNNVAISVTGLEGGASNQDYVLLGRNAGGAIEVDTYSAASAQGANSSTFSVNETINNDDPASGFVRIFNSATNSFNRVAYSSYSGSVFTLSGALGFSVQNNAPCFVPFLDGLAGGGVLGGQNGSISSAIVFNTNINVVGSVRNGSESVAAPIKAFPLSGVITSGGFSVTAVRTLD